MKGDRHNGHFQTSLVRLIHGQHGLTKRNGSGSNKGDDYGGKLNPKTPERWPESRVLRPAFLETILLHEPYRSALTRQGVRIAGAWFVESLDVSNVIIPYQLWLDRRRFAASVNFSGLRTHSLISLAGSKFTGTLNMDSLEVESDLFMRGAEFVDVVLCSRQGREPGHE